MGEDDVFDEINDVLNGPTLGTKVIDKPKAKAKVYKFSGDLMQDKYKKKWVEALRSGDYEQCKLRLKQTDKYDVLGVLADVLKDRGICSWLSDSIQTSQFAYVAYLPKRILDEAKLNLEDACYLADLNDKGWSFVDLAELIDKKL